MFKILKSLPNDGTFDQNLAFARAQEKASTYGVVFGYDLSSATDRLPIDLQVSIVASLTDSDELAKIWKTILIGRAYFAPPNRVGVPEGNYSYAVGQPMGALSSWAMLAITHHLLVQ